LNITTQGQKIYVLSKTDFDILESPQIHPPLAPHIDAAMLSYLDING
jgi:hypothetical protein